MKTMTRQQHWSTIIRRPAAILTLVVSLSQTGAVLADSIRIHFLGTGGPEITKHRMGIATLIEAGDNKFLFDAGRGVLQRMGESQINIPEVTRVFFTHLHSDHIEGLPGFWATSWFIMKRNTPMEFWGPPGTRDMLDGMKMFLGHDVVARVDSAVLASGVEFTVNEFEREGQIYQRDGVTITSVQVEHADGNPAFGYLFDYSGQSVFLTGDTTYTENIGDKVGNVDITISNLYAPSLYLLEHLDDYEPPIPDVVRGVSAKLALPEDGGRIFADTNARLGVYTHIILYDSSEDDVIARTREAGFTGDIIIAHDRMVIELDDTITLHEPVPVADDLEINSTNFRQILERDGQYLH